jgi:Proteasome assembly chaperone 3
VTPMLGDRNCIELQLIARQAIQHTCQFSGKAVLLGVGLSSKPTLTTVKEIVVVLKSMLTPVSGR